MNEQKRRLIVGEEQICYLCPFKDLHTLIKELQNQKQLIENLTNKLNDAVKYESKK